MKQTVQQLIREKYFYFNLLIKTSMENIEVQKKLDVLALVDKLGNISEASSLSAVSRDTIYRNR